jgi:pyruvate/2-oxoglutarate/acetoin dehydrogenase E1 component
MTPKEYERIWEDFMAHDDPMFVSEHRLSYKNTEEMEDEIIEGADITLYAISSARFEARKAIKILKSEGIKCNLVHLLWLKPFIITERLARPLSQTKLGLVIDSSHEIAGASRSIAYELSHATGGNVKALGLLDKTKCLCPPLQNRTPDAEKICLTVKETLDKSSVYVLAKAKEAVI